MKSEIEEIKEKVNKINIEELIKTGKNVFDSDYKAEFKDSIGPAFVLNKTYTCYANEDKLVLRSFKKESHDVNPDVISDADYTASANMIYIKGKEVKELSAPDSSMMTMRKGKVEIELCVSEDEKLREGVEEYKEAFEVIKIASQRSIMQKQHIRNFFRRIFAGKNNNLLDGKSISLTEEEISNILVLIQEKPKKFINKYNTKKTDKDKIVDAIQKADKSKKYEKDDNELEQG